MENQKSYQEYFGVKGHFSASPLIQDPYDHITLLAKNDEHLVNF